MNFPNLQLTNDGINAVLRAVHDESVITFTAVKLGDGAAPARIDTLTDMVNTVMSLGITSITVTDSLAKINFLFNNAGISNNFYLREIGIFATLDEGDPFLYAYANAGSTAAYVKKYSSDTNIAFNYTVAVAIGNAEHVTAIISEAVGYVTNETFEDHTHDYNNPHQVTKSQVGLGNVPNLAPSDMTVTYTKPNTLTTPASGSKLSVFMGALAKAIDTIRGHLMDSLNPHNVTYEQTGAAPADHEHDAGDITSGIFGLERGGTGVTSYLELVKKLPSRTSFVNGTLLASTWLENGEYDLSPTYAIDKYNLEISLSDTATLQQQKAFARARIVGSPVNNTITALGTIPEVNIPIIIEVTEVS